MTPAEQMREAAAKVAAQRPFLVPNPTPQDAHRADMLAIEIAAAIRALPIPPEPYYTAPTMADMQRMTDPLLNDPEAFDAYMEANPLPDDPPVEAMAEALRPFCFFDEDGGDVQAAWEIRYRDRFQDWIDFADIEAARAALAAFKEPPHG